MAHGQQPVAHGPGRAKRHEAEPGHVRNRDECAVADLHRQRRRAAPPA
ncbi:hypothetical protein M8494_23375 [Serratia ureilytica]